MKHSDVRLAALLAVAVSCGACHQESDGHKSLQLKSDGTESFSYSSAAVAASAPAASAPVPHPQQSQSDSTDTFHFDPNAALHPNTTAKGN